MLLLFAQRSHGKLLNVTERGNDGKLSQSFFLSNVNVEIIWRFLDIFCASHLSNCNFDSPTQANSEQGRAPVPTTSSENRRADTMKRVFGKKKEAVPAPSLGEAGGRVDERVAKIDEKVNETSTTAPINNNP